MKDTVVIRTNDVMVIRKEVICLGCFPGIHRWIQWDWQLLLCTCTLLCDTVLKLRSIINACWLTPTVFLSNLYLKWISCCEENYIFFLVLKNDKCMMNAHKQVSSSPHFLFGIIDWVINRFSFLNYKILTCSQAVMYLLLVMYVKYQGLNSNLFILSKNSKLFFCSCSKCLLS